MIIELGHFAVILALVVSILLAVVPAIGVYKRDISLMHFARPAAFAMFSLILFSYFILTSAFLNNDFSVLYVANNSNTMLPWYFRLAAVWGAHEGSLLLWCLILAGWTLAVAMFSKSLVLDFVARVLSTLGFINLGVLCLLLFTSNPFERLIPAAVDGRDLNPLLQDFGLIIHPPMLYMGYIGFSVAFSFAIAALWANRFDSAWARWSRPWTLTAWGFLSLGIALGSWWAYYELGWGGWWFWDPVENASFMPWLVGTALIHSLAVTDKRGSFKSWTVLLAISAFALSLLGTFLVRSGVLTSVHAFATDPVRGVAILIFMSIVVGISLFLYALRAHKIRSRVSSNIFSRDGMLLVNNVLMVVLALVVLLGTLYPLLLDALNLGKVSVGPPYFNLITVPLFLLTGFFIAIGSLSRWQKDDAKRVFRILILPIQGILLLVITVLMLVLGLPIMTVIGLVVAAWLLFSVIQSWRERCRNRKLSLFNIVNQPVSFYSMQLGHIGFALCIIGVTCVSTLDIEKDIAIQTDKKTSIGDLDFVFHGVQMLKVDNYIAQRGKFDVYKDGKLITTLFPEKRRYPVQQSTMTEAAIDAGFTRDIYISLGEELGKDAWSIRVYYKPFIRLMWLGGIFMFIAGLSSIIDKRYRLTRTSKEPLASSTIQGTVA